MAQSDSIANNGAPTFPVNFDRATVTRLITNIDQGTNFPVLKAGYFLGHRRPAFPVAQGIALLEEQVKKEPKASKRWLLMQWLRAFGSLRQNEAGRDKAILVYGGIFDAALSQPQLLAPDVLQRIVYDYVFYVPSDYIIGKEGLSPQGGETLLKALKLYFRLGSPSGDWQPDWVETVWRASDEEKPWLDAIDAASADKRVPKNFNFYLASAQVVRSVNTGRDPKLTARAAALLEKAKALLPAKNAVQIARFYDEQTALFQTTGQDKAAIGSLRSRVAQTGRGQARLLLALYETNDQSGYQTTLADLKKPAAPADEVLEAANALLELKDEFSDSYLEYLGFKTPETRAAERLKRQKNVESAQSDAAALLEALLAPNRARSRGQELQARVLLTRFYQNRKNQEAARRAAAVTGIQVPAADDDDKELWDELAALRREIEKRQ